MSGKGFTITFICFLFLLFILLSMNKSEAMQYYKIQVGEEEISYYVIENTTKKYIEDVIESKIENKQYVDRTFIEVEKDKLILQISKYDCTKENSERKIDCKPFYKLDKLPNTEGIDEKPSSLKILFNDKVLYDSVYKEDIREIIKEEGRYYFIVTYESTNTKKEKQTKLLFSIKVGV